MHHLCARWNKVKVTKFKGGEMSALPPDPVEREIELLRK